MSAFEYRAADIADLEPTVELMARGFPAATKFSPNFLRWQYYDNTMQGYRAWLGDLPPDVARKIGWSNAAGLFGIKTSH